MTTDIRSSEWVTKVCLRQVSVFCEQGSTLTFQLTSLVASGNLDVTSQRRFLLAKRCNSEISPLGKTETGSVNFILFTSQSGQWKLKTY